MHDMTSRPARYELENAITLATDGTIIGVISDAKTGERLPGVTVIATSRVTGKQFAAISDENGRYEILTSATAIFRLTAYSNDRFTELDDVRVVERDSSMWCPNEGIKLEPTTMPETYERTARVEGRAITGTFRNARTGEPLFGATITAERSLGPLLSELTDENGAFRIPAEPGMYHVTGYYLDTIVPFGDVVVL